MPQRKTIISNESHKINKRALVIFLSAMIFLLSIISFASYLYIKADNIFSAAYEDIDREEKVLQHTTTTTDKDKISFLFMGIDARDTAEFTKNSRTDSLMVATLNKEDHTVKLLSIPRDSYVYIPSMDTYTKINHAHTNGGTKSTVDTVEDLLDIQIDYYIKLNFKAFIEIIDVLNGVTVDVPYELKEQNSKGKKDAIHLLPGKQSLNGEEALAFARTRKNDNDIERGKRQQEIIQAIVEKSTSLNSVLKYDEILDAIGLNMKTNLTFNELIELSKYGVSHKIKIQTLTLEGMDYQPDNTYYWQLDQESLEKTINILKEHLNLTSNE